MATVKPSYGSSTAITITLASLADASARESTAVDNSSNLYVDALVRVEVTVGTVANEKACYVYAYGSEDGTNYSGEATGSDAAYTMKSPTTLKMIGVVATPTNSVVHRGLFAVAPAFGGTLPKKWGIVLENQSGASLSASGHAVYYTGVQYTVS